MAERIYNYFSNVKESKVEWLWYPYIPYGKLTVLQGDPGEGKSSFILNIAARLTKGQDMPDGYKTAQPQTVIYQCAEDDVSDTIKPRLIAAGADCEKMAYIIDSDTGLSLDDSRIEDTIKKTHARLLILDPIQSFIMQDGDMQSATRMRSVLGKLAIVAAKYSCAVVLVGHMNKSSGSKNIYRGLGSIDITAIARSVLMIERDGRDSKVRYMYPIKSSLAPEGCSIAFEISENGFRWLGPCDYESMEQAVHDKTSKYDKCIVGLTRILKDGPVKSMDVYNRFSEEGISRRTVNSVKKELGISSFRKEGTWYWCMPDTEAEDE